jgi:hypothetical protein
VTPAAGASGSTTIGLTVSDGTETASTSFLLNVSATPPAPLAFARSVGAFGDPSGTTLSATLTGVQAGSLIVAYVKWEGPSAAVTLSDGTNTFTADTPVSLGNGDLHGGFYYLLSSSASGTVTYTATWNGARPYRRMMIYEYSYSGGTVSFDASNRASGGGALSSGNITTTGTEEIVFGAYGEYYANSTNTERINGVLADQVVRASWSSMWSKSFTAPFTGAATASGNGPGWISHVIAFKRTPP